VLEVSGLFSRESEASGSTTDSAGASCFPLPMNRERLWRSEGRALGDDLPKYLNSPETADLFEEQHSLPSGPRKGIAATAGLSPCWSKATWTRLRVALAGVSNVVASCGTSLTEPQVKLLNRFTRRIIVNYDPDTAGQAATERSLSILLEQGVEGARPCLARRQGPGQFHPCTRAAAAYTKLLNEAPPYVDYLISRASKMDLTSAEGKLRAVNFLMPYVPAHSRSHFCARNGATRIAQQLRIEEPVLRESMRKAANERRSEVKATAGAGGPRREARPSGAWCKC